MKSVKGSEDQERESVIIYLRVLRSVMFQLVTIFDIEFTRRENDLKA